MLFTSHYVFRWRTAMNEYYTEHWEKLRHIEGASQRVQEDTMRFATILEDLGVELVKAVITLIAFLPILFQLSKHVPVLPIVGELEHSLVWAAIVWSIFGTVLLMVVGIKLPGLQFNNQKVEAAYRKNWFMVRIMQIVQNLLLYVSYLVMYVRTISDFTSTMPILI